MKESKIEAIDKIIEDWFVSCYQMAKGNLLDALAYGCGWLPLEVDETMRIHFENKVYIIKRIE